MYNSIPSRPWVYEFMTTYHVTACHQFAWSVNPSSRFEDPSLCMRRRRDQVLKAVLLLLPKYGVLQGVLKLLCGKKMKFPVKIGIGSGVTFFVILIFGWVAFPKLLQSKLRSVSQSWSSSAKYSSHIHPNHSLVGYVLINCVFVAIQKQLRNT